MNQATPQSRKNYWLYIVLAALLGGLGIHRFYLHESLMPGLLYLLFFWTTIPSIIGVVEAVLTIMQGEEEFHRRQEAREIWQEQWKIMRDAYIKARQAQKSRKNPDQKTSKPLEAEEIVLKEKDGVYKA